MLPRKLLLENGLFLEMRLLHIRIRSIHLCLFGPILSKARRRHVRRRKIAGRHGSFVHPSCRRRIDVSLLLPWWWVFSFWQWWIRIVPSMVFRCSALSTIKGISFDYGRRMLPLSIIRCGISSRIRWCSIVLWWPMLIVVVVAAGRCNRLGTGSRRKPRLSMLLLLLLLLRSFRGCEDGSNSGTTLKRRSRRSHFWWLFSIFIFRFVFFHTANLGKQGERVAILFLSIFFRRRISFLLVLALLFFRLEFFCRSLPVGLSRRRIFWTCWMVHRRMYHGATISATRKGARRRRHAVASHGILPSSTTPSRRHVRHRRRSRRMLLSIVRRFPATSTRRRSSVPVICSGWRRRWLSVSRHVMIRRIGRRWLFS